MRIGIITFHFPYNFGAVFQCAALKICLEKLDNQVCVIDYRPWYHQNRYTPIMNPIAAFRASFKLPVRKLYHRLFRAAYESARAVYHWKDYKMLKETDSIFRRFREKWFAQTRTYRTIKQLRKKPPDCELYISGSDQLWNTSLTCNGPDPAYFLDFGRPETFRATYAVGSDFSDMIDPEKALKHLITGLDSISIREKRNTELIKDLAENKVIRQDIDPTLLLEAKDYNAFTGEAVNQREPYIFTYTLDNDSQDSVFDMAERLAEKTGYPVLDGSGLNHRKARFGIEKLKLKPDEFLKYIRDASYVITNSFHGTVFSILYEKSFYTVPHPRTGYRVRELLCSLGLGERCGEDVESGFSELMKIPQYEKARMVLAELRKDSLEYLMQLSQRSEVLR